MDPLQEITLDLCANLATEDRYRRLATAVRRLVPCDSTAILRLQDGVLVPVVVPVVGGHAPYLAWVAHAVAPR